MTSNISVCFLNRRLLPPSLRGWAPLLARAIRLALGARGNRGEVAVIFQGDAAMRRLNRERLRHDRVTDVIAFDYGGPPPGFPRGGTVPLGDIALCVPQARRQAERLGHSFLVELVHLAVHGALHLAGFDDGTLRARQRMLRRQEAVVQAALRPKRTRKNLRRCKN